MGQLEMGPGVTLFLRRVLAEHRADKPHGGGSLLLAGTLEERIEAGSAGRVLQLPNGDTEQFRKRRLLFEGDLTLAAFPAADRAVIGIERARDLDLGHSALATPFEKVQPGHGDILSPAAAGENSHPVAIVA